MTKLPRRLFGDINFVNLNFFVIFIFAAFAMTALEETEYIRTALRDFAKLIAAGIKHLFFFYKESAFTSSIESIISFISFSKCP